MSKKGTIFTIILVIIIIMIGLFVMSKRLPQTGGGTDVRGEDRGFLGNLFPRGGSPSYTPEDPIQIPTETGAGAEQSVRKIGDLTQITASPVAGFISTTTEIGEGIRYILRTTGNVFHYDYGADEQVKRISNTTIPNIYEALWHQKADSLIIRYATDNNNIKSYVAKLETEEDTDLSQNNELKRLEGSFLQDNIANIVTNADHTEIFYLDQQKVGVFGVQSNFQTTITDQVFYSDFSEWLLSWPNNNTLMVTSKPAGGIVGLAYIVDIDSGIFTKLLEGDGLTINPNPKASYILYSLKNKNKISTHVLNRETGEVTDLDIQTLVEKCVWNPVIDTQFYCGVPNVLSAATYPDDWYQGKILFLDSMWKIDLDVQGIQTETNITSLKSITGDSIDVVTPYINPTGTKLLFINKKDSSLWSLNIETVVEEEEGTES